MGMGLLARRAGRRRPCYRPAAAEGGRTPKTKTLTASVSVFGRNILGLLAQSEPFDHVAVLVRVRALQVIEQLATLADHFQQPAARMDILGVRLEMLGETVDTLGEQGDLYLGRAGVGDRSLELFDYLRFLLPSIFYRTCSRKFVPYYA